MAVADKYISRTEAQAQLNLRRDQMIYRIRRGHIKAEKVGWNYVIPMTEIERARKSEWYKAIEAKGGLTI